MELVVWPCCQGRPWWLLNVTGAFMIGQEPDKRLVDEVADADQVGHPPEEGPEDSPEGYGDEPGEDLAAS